MADRENRKRTVFPHTRTRVCAWPLPTSGWGGAKQLKPHLLTFQNGGDLLVHEAVAGSLNHV